MNDAAFERDLRAVLGSLAPADVPHSLWIDIDELRSIEPSGSRWLRRLGAAAVSTAVISLVLVLATITVLRTGWQPAASGAPDAPRAFTWRTQLATLTADELTIEAGGRTFIAPHEVATNSDPGSATYRTLELAWHEDGTEMRLNIYFGADSTSWWVNHIRTYDGRDPGDWIYYLGPSFRTPLGESYRGSVDLHGLGLRGMGRLQITDMTLSAFEPGTIPPSFDSCRAVGARPANLFGPTVSEINPDLSEFGVEVGMAARDTGRQLEAQGICHEFRVQYSALNRGQIWCSPPAGNVRENFFGSAGQIILIVENNARLPLDTELPQVVGC